MRNTVNDLKVGNVIFSKGKKDTKRIYFSSFPKKERMAFWAMNAMSLLWNTGFLNFYDGDRLVGFIYYAHFCRQVFIMFFAVDEKERHKGYGSKILQFIEHKFPKSRIVVSIEPPDPTLPNFQVNQLRKEFYCKNGFSETGYLMKLGVEKEILCANKPFSKGAFRAFLALYSNLVLWPRIWKKDS
jgi:Acetyltransferase (GNAT) family.